ncbi:MAG: hydrogenase maturation protease [Gammaproteobacteria bacterium]|nr:hydrogenase maturation protease [Gammaproteobacteria bacterium]
MSSGSRQPGLLIGIGTDYRGDDQAGLEVARRLRGRTAGVEVREFSGDGAVLLESWAGHDRVILVDVCRSGAPAGTLHHWRLPGDSLPAALRLGSSHAFGLAEALALAGTLGRLPVRLDLHAIEGARFGLGEAMSPAVERAVEALVAQLTAQLEQAEG